MKNLIACLILVMEILHPISAQNKFYNFNLIVGMSPKQLPLQESLIMNREDPMTEFLFNLDEIERNYTFGLRTNIRFSKPFFGTIGLEFNRQRQHYSVLYTYRETGGKKDMTFSNDKLILPVGVGVRLNNFEITSGLQMRYNIKSEMKEEIPMGIEMNSLRVEMGWYTGVAFVMGRTRLGVQYQSSLNRYGDNMTLHQKPMGLSSVPKNVSFTAGLSF